MHVPVWPGQRGLRHWHVPGRPPVQAAVTQHAGWCGELTVVPDANHPPLLALTGVSRRYGERLALSPIDLSVAVGQCVAVMGANGSGKSTLLRIAA